MQSNNQKSTIAKIPANRAKDIEVENVIYSLHKDSHVEIHWGFKGCETGRTLLIPADTYNAFLEDNERYEPVHDLGAYWFNSDFSERREDAAEYMRTYCVLHPELLEGVLENILAIADTFPNKKTYPSPETEEILNSMPPMEIHNAHAAMMYGNVNDL